MSIIVLALGVLIGSAIGNYAYQLKSKKWATAFDRTFAAFTALLALTIMLAIGGITHLPN